jgi:glutamate carboxypeptidase
MMTAPMLLRWCESQVQDSLKWLERLVSIESPSGNRDGLNLLLDCISREFENLDCGIDRLPNPIGVDHLRMRIGDRGAVDRPATLILTHADTVWPVGTLQHMPFRVADSIAHGPGILDMKASFVIILLAVKSLRNFLLPLKSPITILVTSDEEIGSPDGRRWVEKEAGNASRVLVLEPAREDGSLKTSRKGVGRFTLDVRGKAAHAGVAPEQGRNAIVELAHQILAIERLANPAMGTTVNVGTVRGGSATNVVPECASLTLDARAWSIQEADRLSNQLLALRPQNPDCSLHVTGGWSRPPMERTAANLRLFDEVRTLALDLGFDLQEGATGGGSDGNFTSALGVPTLDGLGAEGGGAHASSEHVLIDSLPRRAALLAHLFCNL